MSKPIPITAARRLFHTLPSCTGNCAQSRMACDCDTARPPYQFLEERTKQDPLSPGEKLFVGMVFGLCVGLLVALGATLVRSLP